MRSAGARSRCAEGNAVALCQAATDVRRCLNAGWNRLPPSLRAFLGPEAPLWQSLIIVVPVLAVGLTLILENVDPDYWWHLATGQWILAHQRAPFSDPFSWTHAGQQWVAHEWLAELMLALAARAGGYAAALLLTAGVAVGGFWLLLRGARRYGLSRRALCLLMLLWGGMPLWALAVRPQVWGWALLCLLLCELTAYDTGRRLRLWALPLLFVLWININLTALIGGVCLAVFAAPRLLRRQPDWHLLEVCVACATALLVNPRGVGLLRFALTYAHPGALRYSFIGEWQRPDLHDPTLLPFWLATPLVLPAVWVLVRRRAIWPALLVLLFFVASLRAQRYTPIYGLVLFPFAGWLSWSRAGSREPAADARARQQLRFRSVLFLAPFVAAIIGLGVASRLSASQFRRHPAPRGYPAGAASALLTLRPHARLFNTYTWGGYLIYRLYPTNRVYVDGREEMYGDAFLRRALDLAAGGSGWQQTFDREGIDAAIVERDAGLAQALAADPNWQVAYRDAISVLYLRTVTPRESGS